jgi:energy-coupling factor transporter ATP-binding protein EcfA2
MPAKRNGAAMDDNDLARAGQLPADPADGTAEVPSGPPPGGERSTADGAEEGSKAKRLAALIQQRTTLVLAPTGRKYALAGGVARPCDSEDFVGWCANAFWQEYDEILTKSMIDDVVRALGGSGLSTRPIHVRVGGDLSRITLDLGDSALAVTAQGIRPAPDAVFARPKGTLSLPAPHIPETIAEAAAAVEAVRQALGVEPRTWTACLAWLLAALRPEGPYPILYVRGEQGSGKSTLAKAMLSLIDPRRPDMRALPREPRDLAIRAEHVHVLGFDNVSMVSGENSDALCRLATGDGFDTRQLHSDRDLAVFDAARPMLMTSIIDAATRPDLLDRALIIDLPARAERRDDDEIRAAVELHRPRVLGALLYAIARAMGASGAVTIPSDVRMRAPASFAMRAAPALGLEPDAIVQAYLDSRATAQGVLAEDPVLVALDDFVKPGQPPWSGSVGELLKALNRQRNGERPWKGWPESPKGLQVALQRLAPMLRARGIIHAPPNDHFKGHANVRAHTLARNVP